MFTIPIAIRIDPPRKANFFSKSEPNLSPTYIPINDAEKVTKPRIKTGINIL